MGLPKTRVESLELRPNKRDNCSRLDETGNKCCHARTEKEQSVRKAGGLDTQRDDALKPRATCSRKLHFKRKLLMHLSRQSRQKEKNLISKAEDAVDAASEMRDLHEDLVS